MSLLKLAAYSMHLNPAHKGQLHEYMGVPKDEKISVEAIEEKLKNEKDPHRRKQLQFALNARKFHHKGSK